MNTSVTPSSSQEGISLSNDQFGDLVQQFVEIQVDNMDTQTLVEFVTDILIDDYSKFTDSELKERVDCFNDDGLYEELVDNVTQQYAKQLNTYEKEVFLDVNNTGGKY